MSRTVVTACALLLPLMAGCSDDDAEVGAPAPDRVETTTTASPPPTATGPAVAPPCSAADFDGRLEEYDQVMNQPSLYLGLTNRADPCTAGGYPAVRLLDAAGRPVPAAQHNGGGYIARDPGPTPTEIGVATGATVWFALSSVTICTGEVPEAPTAAAVEITLADETTTTIGTPVPYCPNGTFGVTALSADRTVLQP